MAAALSRALLTVDEQVAALVDLPGVVPGPSGSLQVSLRAPSFLDAVRLVQLAAEQAEALDHHPDVDLRWRTVTFTVSTHSSGGVTAYDVELARRVLAAAAEVGATAVPPPDRVELGIDCIDVGPIRPFWRAVLGYRDQPDEDGILELHHPTGQGPSLWFQPMDPARTDRNRIHLDLFLPAEQIPARIEAALAAGGRLVSDEHAPVWWVLADAEGNEVCLCRHGTDWPFPAGTDR